MSFNRQIRTAPASLQHKICRADAPTAELISAVRELACARHALPAGVRQPNRVHELIGSQAWTDAALALVALDRTRVVRRLIRDETEWRCTLGSQWPVPDWLDVAVEFGHPVLPLAVLGALVESLRESSAASPAATSVPSRSGLHDGMACLDCGNFS